jgi:hypothetical protein
VAQKVLQGKTVPVSYSGPRRRDGIGSRAFCPKLFTCVRVAVQPLTQGHCERNQKNARQPDRIDESMSDERVQCWWCHGQFWKAECEYFDHGDDGEGGEIKGFTCEACQQKNAEDIAGLTQRFLALCEKYKTNPPKPSRPITFEDSPDASS